MFATNHLLKTEARHFFIIDGIGAFISIILLGIILPQFESKIGMPKASLYMLATFPCLFIIYDFFSYFQKRERWRSLLKTIAFANLIYCFFSMYLTFLHYAELTKIGVTYFILEIATILVIVKLEFIASAQID